MAQQTDEQTTYASQDLIDTMPKAVRYPNAIGVYAALALSRGTMGIADIAGWAGISEQAVIRAIDDLQDWNVADWKTYQTTACLRSAYQTDADAVFAGGRAGAE